MKNLDKLVFPTKMRMMAIVLRPGFPLVRPF